MVKNFATLNTLIVQILSFQKTINQLIFTVVFWFLKVHQFAMKEEYIFLPQLLHREVLYLIEPIISNITIITLEIYKQYLL